MALRNRPLSAVHLMRLSPLHGRSVRVVVAMLVLAGSLVTSAAVAQQSAPAVTALQTIEQGLQLCRDASGELRPGAFDVLLLIDDSGSLEGTRNPTDPGKVRFDAIRVLLDGLSQMGNANRGVNIAAASFGERNRFTTLRAFQPLLAEDVSGIVEDLKRAATGRQANTDYITGVGRAVDVLADRPVSNCRILVWFTDGEHDTKGPSAAADGADAEILRETFCRPGGLGERIAEQGVNTFVLLLNPPDGRPESLDASRDVMQVVTGDPVPEFPGAAGSRRAPSGDCEGPLGPQTGLILPVAEVGQLPGLFADIPNIIDGGIAPIPCPYRVDDVATGPLPDGHLIEWISLTDYQAANPAVAPTLANIRIVIGGERFPAQGLLESLSESPPSARFRIRDEARERLAPGWTLAVDDAQNLCLRIRAVVPQFRISTNEPRIVALVPRGLPERLFEDDLLEFRSLPDGAPVTFEAALRSARVAGRLSVVHGEIFNSRSVIPARVVIDGAPVQGEGCAAFQIPEPGTLTRINSRGVGRAIEAPDQALQSSSCVVTPATLGDGGLLDWERALQELNDEAFSCRVGDWDVFVNGQRVAAGSLQLLAGSPAVEVQLRSGTPPDNTELDCTGVTVQPVQLVWQGRPTEIPITLSVAWLKRSNPLIAAALATPIVLVVILLSLGLLWLINERYMRPPDPSNLWGFEARGRLGIDGSGFSITWEDERAALRVSSETLLRVSELERGGLRTEQSMLPRRMPPILRPLAEPVLELKIDGPQQIVVSHPPAPSGRGALPMGFREAVVLTARGGRLPDADSDVPIRLVVLVPKDPEIPGGSAVERTIERHIVPLTEQLVERLRSSSGRDGTHQGGPVDGSGPPRMPMDGPPDVPSGGPPPLSSPPS